MNKSNNISDNNNNNNRMFRKHCTKNEVFRLRFSLENGKETADLFTFTIKTLNR